MLTAIGVFILSLTFLQQIITAAYTAVYRGVEVKRIFVLDFQSDVIHDVLKLICKKNLKSSSEFGDMVTGQILAETRIILWAIFANSANIAYYICPIRALRLSILCQFHRLCHDMSHFNLVYNI